jgi:hypothetical protein
MNRFNVAVGVAAIIGCFVKIIGVVAAIRSCRVTENAINLTEDANRIAKSSLESSRPYISLTAETNDDNEYALNGAVRFLTSAKES